MAESDKRPQFGNRTLTSADDVFTHNAWDNVEWDKEQLAEAEATIANQLDNRLSAEDSQKFLAQPAQFWEDFYNVHQESFFKDRNWLFTEFPELLSVDVKRIFEVGCGAGNSIFPILQATTDKFVFAADYSSKAVDLVKTSPMYDEKRTKAFVCDITDPEFNYPFEPNSLDGIIMIFVLSAVKPEFVQSVILKLVSFLRPGGFLFIRDYGRYDMAQLRFKPNRCIGENTYVRGDGTISHFFTQDELTGLLRNAGLEELSSYTDKRLQVNRGKKLRMYRVWIQCKFVKKNT